MCFPLPAPPPPPRIRGKLLPTPGSGGFGPRQRKEAEPSSVQDADFILPIKARKKKQLHTPRHTDTHTQTHGHTRGHPRKSPRVRASLCPQPQLANWACGRHMLTQEQHSPATRRIQSGVQTPVLQPPWQTQTHTGSFRSLSPISYVGAELFPDSEVCSRAGRTHLVKPGVGMPQPGYFPSVTKVSSAPGQGSEHKGRWGQRNSQQPYKGVSLLPCPLASVFLSLPEVKVLSSSSPQLSLPLLLPCSTQIFTPFSFPLTSSCHTYPHPHILLPPLALSPSLSLSPKPPSQLSGFPSLSPLNPNLLPKSYISWCSAKPSQYPSLICRFSGIC